MQKNRITIKVPLVGCEVTVGEQSGLKTTEYSNSGALGVTTEFKVKRSPTTATKKAWALRKTAKKATRKATASQRSQQKGETMRISVGEGAEMVGGEFESFPISLINGLELKRQKVGTKATAFSFFVKVEGTARMILCEATASVDSLAEGRDGQKHDELHEMRWRKTRPMHDGGRRSGKAEFDLKSSSKLVSEGGKIYDVLRRRRRQDGD